MVAVHFQFSLSPLNVLFHHITITTLFCSYICFPPKKKHVLHFLCAGHIFAAASKKSFRADDRTSGGFSVYLDEFFRAPAWACQCREQQIGASRTALCGRHRRSVSTSLTTMRSSQVQHYISSQGRLPSNQNQKLQFTRDGRPLPGRQT